MFGEVHEGDVLEVLRGTPDATYHGCLTDPPYGLSFMGHGWDHGVPSADVWREVLRVMKPGAHLLAFGGTRTFHRLTCAIEDAGFEVRDVAMWMYGSGFPKSHNGPWGGTALKPAYEPILVARRPLAGTVAANVQTHGCGGLAIDACRVGTADKLGGGHSGAGQQMTGGWRRPWMDDPVAVAENAARSRAAVARAETLGRWPANVILDEEAGAALDAQSGERRSTLTGRADPAKAHAHPADPAKRRGSMFGNESAQARVYADTGGASRFFYCAKASRAERDAGLDGFATSATSRYGEQGQGPTPQQTPRRQVEQRNIHPTVKPITLARYLARLILPPVEGARLVVPFCGSGSEVIGALQAGWAHVEGIDSWDVAVRIARARIAHHIAELAHVGT